VVRPKRMNVMRVGQINVRGLGIGKHEDICKELEEQRMDVVAITETHLRGSGCLRSGKYELVYKGRSKQQTKGGGVGIIIRSKAGFEIEEINVGESEMSEDIFAMKIEYATTMNERMQTVMIVCYMTVDGVRSECENREKYVCMKKSA